MTDGVETYHDRISHEVSDLVGPILEDLGYELVEVQFRREQHGQVLRVIIFHPDGIGVDDCARVSREVSHLLDVEDIVEQAYNLEVSSPGLDRPLKTERDFSRYQGKKIRIILADTYEELVGEITEVSGGKVVLDHDGDEMAISLDGIKKAKLVY